jgi:hypothetical protein
MREELLTRPAHDRTHPWENRCANALPGELFCCRPCPST